MSSPQFHQTNMGHKYFGKQLPEQIKAMNRLASALEKSNELQESKAQKESSSTEENYVYYMVTWVSKRKSFFFKEATDFGGIKMNIVDGVEPSIKQVTEACMRKFGISANAILSINSI